MRYTVYTVSRRLQEPGCPSATYRSEKMKRVTARLLSIAALVALIIILLTVSLSTPTIREARAWAAARSVAAAIAQYAADHDAKVICSIAGLEPGATRTLDTKRYDELIRVLSACYRLDNPHRFPKDEVFRDPWGNRFSLTLTWDQDHKSPYVKDIRSAGPNGKLGDADDVTDY